MNEGQKSVEAVEVQLEEDDGKITRKSFGVTLGGPDDGRAPLIETVDLNNYHCPNDKVFPYYALGSKIAFVETTTTYDRRYGTKSTHVSGYMPASVVIYSCYCDDCADCFGCFTNYTLCCCRYQLACKPCAKAEKSPHNTCECLKTPILGAKSYYGCCCLDTRGEVDCFTAGKDIQNMPCLCNCCGLTMCYNCNMCKCMCCKSLKYINEN